MTIDTKKKQDPTLRLNEFPLPTYQDWHQAVEKSLKGSSFEEKLLPKTYEVRQRGE